MTDTDVSRSVMDEFKFHIQTLSRFIYVVTEEEDSFLNSIHQLLKSHENRVKVYNPTAGLIPLNDYLENCKTGAFGTNETQQINVALSKILEDNPDNNVQFYVILDPERFLREPTVVRRYLNIAHQMNGNERVVKIMIFVSNQLFVPKKLAKYISVVHDPGLTDGEISEYVEKQVERLRKSKMSGFGKGKAATEPLVRQLRGLTRCQIHSALSQSIITTKHREGKPKLDLSVVADYKRSQLNQSSLVKYYEPKETFDQVGGLGRFKQWAIETKACWTDEGQAFGLKPPRGVLAVGVYGCGKSLSTKALAACWGIPLIQLDTGRLRSSGVGDTEANVYEVIRLAESVAPAILWSDEAEKDFSGAESSASSDAGTTNRMLSILSTWLQETKSHICLAMTANRIKGLPSEMISRANERFFFDLPSEEERIDILKIHLEKVGRDPAKFPLQELAEASVELVGREIEQAIEAALRQSFFAGKKDLDADILATELKSKPRLLRTSVDDLNEILNWVGYDPNVDDGVRARMASGSHSEAFLKMTSE